MTASREEKVWEKCAEVEKLLQNEGIVAECCQYLDLPAMVVFIPWGDWKHSHARAKWLIEENVKGITFLSAKVTEENGSDCYSAEYRYIINF